MNKRKIFTVAGVLAALLAFGLMLSGCDLDTSPANGQPPGGNEKTGGGTDEKTGGGDETHTAFYGKWKGSNGYGNSATWFSITDTTWEYLNEYGDMLYRKGTYTCSGNEATFTETHSKSGAGNWTASNATFTGSILISGDMHNSISSSYPLFKKTGGGTDEKTGGGDKTHTAFYGKWKGSNGYGNSATWFSITDTTWEYLNEYNMLYCKGTYTCSGNEATFTQTHSKSGAGNWTASNATFTGSILISGDMRNSISSSYPLFKKQ